MGFCCFCLYACLNYPTIEHLRSKLLKSLQALLRPPSPSSVNKWRQWIFALQEQTVAWEMDQAIEHASEPWCIYLMFMWTQRREAVI